MPNSSRSSTSSETRPSVNSNHKRSYSTKKESMNGPLYMQTVNRTVLVRRLKRKGDGPSKQLARWFVENQIGTNMPNCPHKRTPFPSRSWRRRASRKLPEALVSRSATVAQHCLVFHNFVSTSHISSLPLGQSELNGKTDANFLFCQVSPSTYWLCYFAPITSSRDPKPTPQNSSLCKSTTTGQASMAPALTTCISFSWWWSS